MSIADKITQLTTIRGDIRTALTDKGVSASDHDYADFAQDISSIPSGGGGFAYSMPITKGTVHIFNPTPIYITLEVN